MKALLTKFKHGLQRTKTALVRNLQGLFNDSAEWTEESYDELEAALIGADLGVGVSMQLVDDIRDRYKRGEIQTAADIIASAKADVVELLKSEHEPMAFMTDGPTVILMVGVNGSGKTTTSGKLAAMWKAEGKDVMLAACDTFRAAACEQLKIWGTRVGCPVISSHHGADPASVAYDACRAARARGTDVLIIDTAGRQHTASNLMRELSKIHRSCDKASPGSPHHTWLVVDGSTGTNALAQARAFTQHAALNGLCLTKLDGSSKGGVVVAIHAELHYPIRFLGLGEEVEDLQPFDADMFADSMFSMD